MSRIAEKRATLDNLQPISQKLKLICGQCGDRTTYDVGRILYELKGEGDSAKTDFAFTNYFRCRKCNSAGPWEVADAIKLLGLTLQSTVSKDFDGLSYGHCRLFDGTVIQTPAMGEDYLRKLIREEPNNAFLCSRLGNLFRACGKTTWANEWFERTLRLDPRDIEARHHLFSLAADEDDIPAALDHALHLVRHLSDGKQAENAELTEALAVDFVETLRVAPDEFQRLVSAEASKTPPPLEARFLQSILEAEGDADEIIDNAVERLLSGNIEALSSAMITKKSDDRFEPAVDPIASLRELVIAEGLNAEKLNLALEVNESQKLVRVVDRRSVPLYDGKKAVSWEAPPLREMFRGDRQPPPDSEMNRYPPEYCCFFYLIENHVLLLSDQLGDRTDQELEEVYSLLRRRPDGKSVGTTHDVVWQAAALMLGKYALSQAEFEAIFGQLARSARHWAQSPISRNYLGYLRKTFRGEPPE